MTQMFAWEEPQPIPEDLEHHPMFLGMISISCNHVLKRASVSGLKCEFIVFSIHTDFVPFWLVQMDPWLLPTPLDFGCRVSGEENM